MINAFGELKEEISEIPEIGQNSRRIWSFSNLKSFFSWTGTAFKFCLREPEIFLFAFMQIVAIGIAYYVWVQFLGWVPDEIWRSEEKLTNITLNLCLLAWSFLCVGLASFPVAIFSGCIGASHFLKSQGYPSTVASCIRLVIPRAWSLWIFCWIDGWFTVCQILERLPKKNNAESGAVKILKELLYYAWKLGTVGMLPSLLNGKNLGIAGKESILLIRNHPQEVMLLRGGYSLACWIIGLMAYLGAFAFFLLCPSLFSHGSNHIYDFYVLMGLPIMVAVGVIQLFLRPIFILGSCQLYSEFSIAREIKPEFKKSPNFLYSSFVGFGLLCLIAAAVFLYREPLGLMNVLEFRNVLQHEATVKIRNEAENTSQDRKSIVPDAGPSQAAAGPAVSVASTAKKLTCANPIVRIVGDRVEEECRD